MLQEDEWSRRMRAHYLKLQAEDDQLEAERKAEEDKVRRQEEREERDLLAQFERDRLEEEKVKKEEEDLKNNREDQKRKKAKLLKKAWKSTVDENGYTLFTNALTGEKTWDDPLKKKTVAAAEEDTTQSDWEEVDDGYGNIYYNNLKTVGCVFYTLLQSCLSSLSPSK